MGKLIVALLGVPVFVMCSGSSPRATLWFLGILWVGAGLALALSPTSATAQPQDEVRRLLFSEVDSLRSLVDQADLDSYATEQFHEARTLHQEAREAFEGASMNDIRSRIQQAHRSYVEAIETANHARRLIDDLEAYQRQVHSSHWMADRDAVEDAQEAYQEAIRAAKAGDLDDMREAVTEAKEHYRRVQIVGLRGELERAADALDAAEDTLSDAAYTARRSAIDIVEERLEEAEDQPFQGRDLYAEVAGYLPDLVPSPSDTLDGTGDEAPTKHVGDTFDATNSSVTFAGPEQRAMVPMSGDLSRGPNPMANKPGVGYDAQVQWGQTGPTGFGRYSSLSVADVGPDARYDPTDQTPGIFRDGGTLFARPGGRGGLWRRSLGGGGSWTQVTWNLPAPFHTAQAAMDPTDAEHIFALIAKANDRGELILYETTDGGKEWSRVSYFAEPEHTLNDVGKNFLAYASSVEIHVFDNGQNIFLYNYNGDHWGYYSTNGGDDWHTADLDVEPHGTALARNKLYATDQGGLLLNATDGELYRSTDYGQTWSQIADYSDKAFHAGAGADEGMSFALSSDNQTVRVFYKQAFSIDDSLASDLNDGSVTQDLVTAFQNNDAAIVQGGNVKVKNKDKHWKVFNGDLRWLVWANGTQLKVRTCCYLDTSTDGGESFESKNLSEPFPADGPQGLLIDPDTPERLTAFIYMEGPYISQDGGDTWTRVYADSVDQHLWQNQFYDSYTITRSGPSKGMAKPTDYRDVMVLDEFPGNPILVGSDQGLFFMSHPTEEVSPTVFWNAAAGMDHSEVYSVEVDDCGNLYHGLWHHSAMIRPAHAEDEIAADSLFYYGDDFTLEAGNMFVKSKSDCLGWASVGSNFGDPPQYDFKTYVSDQSGTLKNVKADFRLKYKGTPVFENGMWYYVERSTDSLNATPPDSSKFRARRANGSLVQAPRGRNPKKDRPANAVWYLTGARSTWWDWPQQIKRIQGGTTETSLDLSDSSVNIKGNTYDVYNGRVAVVLEDARREDILIYEHDSEGALTEDDIPSVENPFPMFENPEIKEVWVDPTDSDRYFAEVLEDSDAGAQCPFHFMVTEDAGTTWTVFSRHLNCTNVYDVAINEKTETAYVATHHRGVLEGDLSGLDDATDLRVDVSCEEAQISASGTMDCRVDFEVDGPGESSWSKAANSVQIDVSLPVNQALYTLSTDRSTLRDAGCIARRTQDDEGFSVVERLECTSALDNFPVGRGLPLDIKIDRPYIITGMPSVDAQIGAQLQVNTSPQDLRPHNDTTGTSVTVFDHPKPDRYDPRPSGDGGEIVSNDTISTPARLAPWTHDRARHHLACPGGDGTGRTNCASVLTDPSDAAPRAAEEVWVQEVDALSLWSSGDVDYYEIPLPDFDSPLMKDKLSNLECGMNSITMKPEEEDAESQRDGDKKKRTDAPEGQYATALLFQLDGQYKSDFANATPKGYTLRPVPSNVQSAFASEGESLSSRARIRLPTGVTDWQNASRWKIIDGSTTYFVEPDGNTLRVLSAQPATSVGGATTVDVETQGYLKVTLVPADGTPEDNPLGGVGVSPGSVRLQSYADTTLSSRLRDLPSTSDSTAHLRINCPRSQKSPSRIVLGVGEDDQAAGEYSLRLEYRVGIRRTKP